VVKLIAAIAEQTNLLALNATIEATPRRWGRPRFRRRRRRGQIAGQPGRKGDRRDIIAHLGHAGATQESVAAIKEIGGTIAQISNIASAIASAEEQQSGATEEIARNVQSVARGTHEAAANIMRVNRGATETGSASEEVLSSAKMPSSESARPREELNRFMANIRAA
jgi:methyl-accepting chemotaxis protein